MTNDKLVTGIYGGSFNPIHNGHTALGRWLVEHGDVDELWFLVSPQNPLKHEASLLDDAARLHLAQLAVEDASTCRPSALKLKVSDFEFHLPRPSFMAHTLRALREAYADREFVLVIGADNWVHFSAWRDPEDILHHHRLFIYPRPGFPLDEANLPQGVSVVSTPLIPVSSTEIRDRIAYDPYYSGQGLAPQVWKEIQAKGYYQ